MSFWRKVLLGAGLVAEVFGSDCCCEGNKKCPPVPNLEVNAEIKRIAADREKSATVYEAIASMENTQQLAAKRKEQERMKRHDEAALQDRLSAIHTQQQMKKLNLPVHEPGAKTKEQLKKEIRKLKLPKHTIPKQK